WAVSGIYVVYPAPFSAFIDYLQPDDAQKGLRAGDEVLRWVARLHFGRFGGWPIKTLWFVIGFAPVVLFITGMIMWWNRVISPLLEKEWWRRERAAANGAEEGGRSPRKPDRAQPSIDTVSPAKLSRTSTWSQQ